MRGAALVHPDHREVIPLAPEPIVQADGDAQNDGERHATRRWLKRFRQEHPNRPTIVAEDGLAANAPHRRDWRGADARFIIGVKSGDHAFWFQHLWDADEAGRTQTLTQRDADPGLLHHVRFHHDVPLHESNPDMGVNVLEYGEIHPTKIVQKVPRAGTIPYFSGMTDLPLTPDTVHALMRGGRARGKIENETFNTLKNQGDNLEHNDGHGEQHLSVVLAMLMMLAFHVDQTQQRCCPVFQAARAKYRTQCDLWEQIRYCFKAFLFDSMAAILEALVRGIALQKPNCHHST